MLKRGSTIGILGGGQLGRMMAVAATQLGYRCIGYSPEGDNVAAEVCEDFFTNRWDDQAALAAFAARCDVVTWEFENVPLAVAVALFVSRRGDNAMNTPLLAHGTQSLVDELRSPVREDSNGARQGA